MDSSASYGGIDETYHWHDIDSAGSGSSMPLLYGWAWLLALGEMLVGGDSSVLATSEPFTADRNHTSVTGLAVSQADALYIIVSSFNPDCYNSSSSPSAMSMALTTPPPRSVPHAPPMQARLMRACVRPLSVCVWLPLVSPSWSLDSRAASPPPHPAQELGRAGGQ